MQFDTKFSFANKVPTDLPITGFIVRPVREVKEDEDTVTEECQEAEAEAFGIYVQTSKETMWIADLPTRKEADEFISLLSGIVIQSLPNQGTYSFKSTISDAPREASELGLVLRLASDGKVSPHSLELVRNLSEAVMIVREYVSNWKLTPEEWTGGQVSHPTRGQIALINFYGGALRTSDSKLIDKKQYEKYQIAEMVLTYDKLLG